MHQDRGLNVVSTGEGTGHDRGAACMLSAAAYVLALLFDEELIGGQNDTLFKLRLSRTLEPAHSHDAEQDSVQTESKLR